MTDALGKWIAGYVKAWNSNDPADIRAIFTEDAAYYSEPYAAPWRGHDEIVQRWLAQKDEPHAASFEWEPLSISDDVAVVTGTSTYPGETYSNLWVIRLAPDGRATQFTDWWMEQPKDPA